MPDEVTAAPRTIAHEEFLASEMNGKMKEQKGKAKKTRQLSIDAINCSGLLGCKKA